jgi:hypothetical protein
MIRFSLELATPDMKMDGVSQNWWGGIWVIKDREWRGRGVREGRLTSQRAKVKKDEMRMWTINGAKWNDVLWIKMSIACWLEFKTLQFILRGLSAENVVFLKSTRLRPAHWIEVDNDFACISTRGHSIIKNNIIGDLQIVQWPNGSEDMWTSSWWKWRETDDEGRGEERKCCQLQLYRFFERSISTKLG